jgi:hypothetical protein
VDINTIASILTAVATIGAVIVALFKDDISQWRNRVKLEVSDPVDLKENTIEADETTHNNTKASKYFTELQIKNNSNRGLAEISCCIGKLSVVNKVKGEEELRLDERSELKKFAIYPQTKLYIRILEISNSENSSNNNEAKDRLDIQNIRILGTPIDKKYHNSEIKADICIYSGRDLYLKACFTLRWDGKWEASPPEFRKHVRLTWEKQPR